jgi:hypothetical protein
MARPIKITTRGSVLSSVGFFDHSQRWHGEDRGEDHWARRIFRHPLSAPVSGRARPRRCRQAIVGPEELVSLGTQARRSQPGRAGPVNSRSPKNMIAFHQRRGSGVDRLCPVWLPCGRLGGEGDRLRPTAEPSHPPNRTRRTRPSPLVSGPPEALFAVAVAVDFER